MYRRYLPYQVSIETTAYRYRTGLEYRSISITITRWRPQGGGGWGHTIPGPGRRRLRRGAGAAAGSGRLLQGMSSCFYLCVVSVFVCVFSVCVFFHAFVCSCVSMCVFACKYYLKQIQTMYISVFVVPLCDSVIVLLCFSVGRVFCIFFFRVCFRFFLCFMCSST